MPFLRLCALTQISGITPSAHMHLETIAVHAGHEVDALSGAVTPPIHLSTTFERSADGSYRSGYVYTRSGNPNRASLEKCLAELEGGSSAASFASGSGATLAVFQALEPGTHVIAPNDAYYGTAKLLGDIFARWGLRATFVDMTNLDEIARAIEPSTRLVWIETPSNPLLKVVDIRAVAELARQHGARSVVDNSWATPVLQRPLELGADIVMHSTTKYLSGHSDVLGGALVFRADDEMTQRIRTVQTIGGIVPAPFDCWLTLRGIRTLPWRMRAHSSNALTLAQWLSRNPGVEAVHYPGLPGHAGHNVAHGQMSQFGGMLAVQVCGGRREAMAVASRLRVFTQATSLGGTESLVEHRASVEGPATRAPENLLRVSVGLEHVDDLIEDFAQALGKG
jgi:cystathionine gamma-synthase